MNRPVQWRTVKDHNFEIEKPSRCHCRLPAVAAAAFLPPWPPPSSYHRRHIPPRLAIAVSLPSSSCHYRCCCLAVDDFVTFSTPSFEVCLSAWDDLFCSWWFDLIIVGFVEGWDSFFFFSLAKSRVFLLFGWYNWFVNFVEFFIGGIYFF